MSEVLEEAVLRLRSEIERYAALMHAALKRLEAESERRSAELAKLIEELKAFTAGSTARR